MKHILIVTALLSTWCIGSFADDPPPPTIEKLIEQLGSRSFAERERASKLLRDRGAAALPAVRKALESKDEEVRKRAEVLIPALEIEHALLPKRVNVKATGTPAGQVLTDLEKQTGYKFSMSGKESSLKLTFDLTDAPFWEAMDRVASEAGLGLSFQSHEKKIHVSVSPKRSPFVNVRGPFRLEATWVHEDRDVDLTMSAPGKEPARDDRLTLAVSLLAEPRITFLKIAPAKVEEALDADGKSLLDPVGAAGPKSFRVSGRGTFRGEFLHSTDIRLRRATQEARSIKVIRGTIPVKVILIRKPVVVTSKVMESTGTKFRAGTDGLEITRVNNQGGGSIEVQIAVPRQQNENWEWHERFHLEDDAGNRFQDHGRGSSSNGMQYWISLYYGQPFNKKNVGAPTKLILEDWIVHDYEIPFEFKDVPLP